MTRSDEQSRLSDIDQRLENARQKTWSAVDRIAAAIHPGMRESEAIKLAQQTLATMGTRKFWHKCHVRFGKSTTLSFNDPYSDEMLKSDDILYIDIGPIWDRVEGDAGATFVAGNSEEFKRCRDDAKSVFDDVSHYWRSENASGKSLYEFAKERAETRGWILAPSYVRGHRLSEFPHSFHSKRHVDELDFCPLPNRWVLEIHICDPAMRFGAFYEDLL